jgi:hypothetical protein
MVKPEGYGRKWLYFISLCSLVAYWALVRSVGSWPESKPHMYIPKQGQAEHKVHFHVA